jgi:hypothetical protein
MNRLNIFLASALIKRAICPPVKIRKMASYVTLFFRSFYNGKNLNLQLLGCLVIYKWVKPLFLSEEFNY